MEDQGGLVFAIDLGNSKLGKPVVQREDMMAINVVSDIVGAIQRNDTYQIDKMIYVIGDLQDYTSQFLYILPLMEDPFVDSLKHVNFGRVNGMSTRREEVNFLEDILDELKEAMMAQMKSNEEKFKATEDSEKMGNQKPTP